MSPTESCTEQKAIDEERDLLTSMEERALDNRYLDLRDDEQRDPHVRVKSCRVSSRDTPSVADHGDRGVWFDEHHLSKSFQDN